MHVARIRRQEQPIPANVFVIGLDDFGHELIGELREAPRYRIHPLLATEDVVKADGYDYDALARQADEQLRDFDGIVDAVVTWWDFPSSGLVPYVSELWDTYGPSLKSVLRLEHKYWSRLIQRAVAAEHVPAFAVFEPDDEAALETIADQGVQFPFWVKPVKSVASYLGFKVEDEQDLLEAQRVIDAEIDQYGDPFQQALEHIDLPPDIRRIGARACIAEGLIGGFQCTLEGYVSFGEVVAYGVVDSLREDNASTFRAYQYPSRLPTPVQRRMQDIATDVIVQSELDHACFNMEFFYDRDQGHIWLLEVNTRPSLSHCDLFAKVDGASHQRALLDVAMGRQPRMPHRLGEYDVAGKYFLRAFVDDGVVTSAPSEQRLAEVKERFPGVRIQLDVAEGDRLSEVLTVQETYSFELGRVWLGGDDHDDLDRRFDEVAAMLALEVE